MAYFKGLHHHKLVLPFSTCQTSGVGDWGEVGGASKYCQWTYKCGDSRNREKLHISAEGLEHFQGKGQTLFIIIYSFLFYALGGEV